MRNKLALLSLAAAMLVASPIVCPIALAADAPASQPASQEKLKATITAVQGLVQVRDADGQPWRKAEVGMVLLEDAEFRTGPKSAVQFTIPPDQTVSLDRLGTVKLVQAIKQNGKIITNLGMKYGRTRYDIEAAGQEHESTISSPSSTLAVRGTKVSLYDQRPFNVEAVSLTGRASFRDGKKQLSNFGNKGQGKTTVAAGETDAAGFALGEAVLDPTLTLARGSHESQLISTLVSRGSTLSVDRTTGIKVVTGGTPPTDTQLIPTLPGELNFVLRWNTDANLNICVGSPGGRNGAGEVLYPVSGLDSNQSGGAIPFDHRGGPNGGIEIAYWNGTPPQGLYALGAILVSSPTGATAVSATMDAFLGGQHVQIFDGTSLVNQISFTVIPPVPGVSNGTLAGIAGVGVSVPGAPGGTEPGAPPVSSGTTGEPGAPPTVAAAATLAQTVAPAATVAPAVQTTNSTQKATKVSSSTVTSRSTAVTARRR